MANGSSVSPMWHCKLVRGWEVCWLVDGPAESPEGIFPRVTAIGVVVRYLEYVSFVGYHGGSLSSLDRCDSVLQVTQWHIAGASGQGWTRRIPWCCQCGMGPDVNSTQCKVLLLRDLRCSLQRRPCWLVAVWLWWQSV